MNIWIAVWVFITVFILGITIWSLRILMRQKMVWRQFAARHNMTYTNRGILNSPIVSGVYHGQFITFMSDKQMMSRSDTDGLRTVVQFDMKPGIGVEGIIASPNTRNFVNGLKIHNEIVPDFPSWNKGIIIRTQNTAILNPYLTHERLKTINALMSIKNTNAMLLFNEGETFFRFETADPFDNIETMEKQIKKIIDAAKVLEIN